MRAQFKPIAIWKAWARTLTVWASWIPMSFAYSAGHRVLERTAISYIVAAVFLVSSVLAFAAIVIASLKLSERRQILEADWHGVNLVENASRLAWLDRAPWFAAYLPSLAAVLWLALGVLGFLRDELKVFS